VSAKGCDKRPPENAQAAEGSDESGENEDTLNGLSAALFAPSHVLVRLDLTGIVASLSDADAGRNAVVNDRCDKVVDSREPLYRGEDTQLGDALLSRKEHADSPHFQHATIGVLDRREDQRLRVSALGVAASSSQQSAEARKMERR